MTTQPARFCDCMHESECQYGKTGRSFSICRGTCEGMALTRMADYRRKWAAQAGVADASRPQPTAECSTCTGIVAAAKGAVGIVKAAFGLDETPRAQLVARLEICDLCSENDLGRCAACGCFVAAKARVAAEACPENRWGPS